MREHSWIGREVIEELSQSKKEPKWLLEKRLEGLDIFQKSPQPSFRYGIGIVLNTSGLDVEKIRPLESLENQEIKTTSTDDNLVIMDIFSALKKHGDIIKEFFMRKAVPPKGKFEALHSMFWNQGVFIYVPKGLVVKNPVNIDINMNASCQFLNLLIIAEPMSKVSFTQTHSSSGRNSFRSEVVEIFVKDSAQVNYSSMQTLSTDVFNFATKRAIVERDAEMNWIDCCVGSRLSRAETTTFLNGMGSRSNNWCMFFGNEKQQFDLSSATIHNAEQTNSDMVTKGVLDDQAKAIYRGLIRINQNAPNSNGYQKEDTLLLSSEAEADPAPNLEIHNNNVKCSHGVSIGQINAEKIFYLMSRGLSDKQSKKLIVQGFFEPMIRGIGLEKTRNGMRNLISGKIIAKEKKSKSGNNVYTEIMQHG